MYLITTILVGAEVVFMKSMRVELSEKVVEELAQLVQAGWFRNEEEAIRLAVVEFLAERRLDLVERFEREDIDWALRQKRAEPL